MIKVKIEEFRKGDFGYITKRVTFFGILLYKAVKSTSNNDIVRKLTIKKKDNQIIGFSNETNHQSKKTRQ